MLIITSSFLLLLLSFCALVIRDDVIHNVSLELLVRCEATSVEALVLGNILRGHDSPDVTVVERSGSQVLGLHSIVDGVVHLWVKHGWLFHLGATLVELAFEGRVDRSQVHLVALVQADVAVAHEDDLERLALEV